MPEPSPSPLQRLFLALYAFFAVLFRAEVAARVWRIREERRALAAHGGPGTATPTATPTQTPTPTPTSTSTSTSSSTATSTATAPSPSPAPTRADGAERAALRLLAALQREGRLVDFVEEDVAAYTDEQIGAAARTVHAGCKRAIDEHFRLEPVYREPEGATVTVATGFDPSAVRLTGNVVGQPPFRGQLRHHGWKARDVKLPGGGDAVDPSVVAPAEVEL
jgi:hypothetical protein